MFEIDASGFNEQYHLAYKFVADRLYEQLNESKIEWAWIRIRPQPPCLEHISFRCGNQLFFVRIISESFTTPGCYDGLIRISTENNGIACLFPLECINGEFIARNAKWGLIDAYTRKEIDPPEKIIKEYIPLSEWELYRLALDYVIGILKKYNVTINDFIDDPCINPSIWIEDKEGKLRWILVRHLRGKNIPDDWDIIVKSRPDHIGYFVNIKFACEFDYGTWNLDNPSPPIGRCINVIVFPCGVSEMLIDLGLIDESQIKPKETRADILPTIQSPKITIPQIHEQVPASRISNIIKKIQGMFRGSSNTSNSGSE